MSLRETVDRVTAPTKALLSLGWEEAIHLVDAQLEVDVRLARAIQARLAGGGRAVGTEMNRVLELWRGHGPSAQISKALGRRFARPVARDQVSGRTLVLMAAAGICLVGISASFAMSLGWVIPNLFGLGYTVCSCDHFAALHKEAGAAGVVMLGLGSLLFLGGSGFGLRAALRSPDSWVTTFNRVRHGIVGTGRCAAIVGRLAMSAWRKVFRRPEGAVTPSATAA